MAFLSFHTIRSSAMMCETDDTSLSRISSMSAIELDSDSSSTHGADGFDLILDNEAADETTNWEASSGSTASPSPSLYAYETEHGRRYHSHNAGKYPLPNDWLEQQREGTKHALMLELTDGRLFYSDVGDNPQRIIDIGTGAGQWAIDVADLFPSASVIGTDLSPIQPTWLPPNLRMFLEDSEEAEWLHGSGFDLVRLGGVSGVLSDLGAFLNKIHPFIRDGGWVEFHELMPAVYCEDESMKANDPLKLFAELCVKGMQQYGCRSFGSVDFRGMLERAGFTNIQCVTKRVPVGPWVPDNKLHPLGLIMKELILESLGAYTAKPMEALGIPLKQRHALAKQVRRSLEDLKTHRYVDCCFYYGQKSELCSDSETYSSI